MEVGFDPRMPNQNFSVGSISRDPIDPLEGSTRVSLPQLRKSRPIPSLGRRKKNVIGCGSGEESYADFIVQSAGIHVELLFCKEGLPLDFCVVVIL
jgi:hypothetical protein